MSDEMFGSGDEEDDGERLHIEDSADCWCEPLLIADCPACLTTGAMEERMCSWCKGSGYLTATGHGPDVHVIHVEAVEEGEEDS